MNNSKIVKMSINRNILGSISTNSNFSYFDITNYQKKIIE